MQESTAEFQRIDTEVLNRNKLNDFDIYVKTSKFGKETFIKYCDRNKQNQRQKLYDLLSSNKISEDLYIKTTDLIDYYEHATQTMREYLSDQNIDIAKKFEKIYALANNLTQSFFEHHASPNILRSSPQVVELLHSCLKNEEFVKQGLKNLANKDYFIYTHSVNVGLYCMSYGIKSGLPEKDVAELGLGGMLHDVGQVEIADTILKKPDRLTDREFEAVKKHTKIGRNLLEKLDCFSERVLQMVGQHHENHDGSGYHEGLRDDQISFFAKICAIADIYDTLISHRSYGKPLQPFEAFNLIKEEMKNEFDPKVFANFVRLMGPSF